MTDAERAHLAAVKSVPCVFCNAKPPTEGHHPKGCQGLHWLAVSACEACHEARAWNLCSMTEMQAVNETLRRVELFKANVPINLPEAPITSRQNSTRTPSKIIPRAA